MEKQEASVVEGGLAGTRSNSIVKGSRVSLGHGAGRPILKGFHGYGYTQKLETPVCRIKNKGSSSSTQVGL